MAKDQRIITLQKQLRTARVALALIRDGDGNSLTAQYALDEIDHIEFTKGNRTAQQSGGPDA